MTTPRGIVTDDGTLRRDEVVTVEKEVLTSCDESNLFLVLSNGKRRYARHFMNEYSMDKFMNKHDLELTEVV